MQFFQPGQQTRYDSFGTTPRRTDIENIDELEELLLELNQFITHLDPPLSNLTKISMVLYYLAFYYTLLVTLNELLGFSENTFNMRDFLLRAALTPAPAAMGFIGYSRPSSAWPYDIKPERLCRVMKKLGMETEDYLNGTDHPLEEFKEQRTELVERIKQLKELKSTINSLSSYQRS